MIDKNVRITTEYIKLDQLLKFSGAVSIGSEAKQYIAEGKVKFNGEVCTMRGKKVRPGDVVNFNGTDITVE
ncbi:MAG: RNA-binding S4 domain-containing protein [Oscillospiraceae bacterium]|nr:RNA-binding S4 domain-containing protein [Oscillospiraceae bacterium]